MNMQPIAILNSGLVTSVGMTTDSSCAAIRVGISNAQETRFIGADGEWVMGHKVTLEQPLQGMTKLVKMAVMAIRESLAEVPKNQWKTIPLLLCVAERERPGRLEFLDDQLFNKVQQELKVEFAPGSSVIPYGRVSVAMALQQARQFIYSDEIPLVLIVASDSLLNWPTLSVYVNDDRLLSNDNSNGFIPGEAGAAILVSKPDTTSQLCCLGIGVATEKAHIDSEEPLRADGLTNAIAAALADASREMHELDFRICDVSGEQYYFKEAALALSRSLRRSKEDFDIWHPADCIGEVGAAAGVVMLIVANVACSKAYSKGINILAHMASDPGLRVAIVLHWRSH
ncbi:3-oxoacyl-[ACP] synthase [hydrothermal vent metagenome]|uniref:3-oxoacyl-[ACP] synthase n=1 Tax=hydrothermal vent metagenome TaxID=652676 RepID=A0A3B0ZCE0_9ZZZZ